MSTSTTQIADLPRGLELTSLSPEFRDNPFAVLKRLREAAPIFEDGQLRDHVVSTAALVQKVVSDPTLLVDSRNMAETSTRGLRNEDLSVATSMMRAFYNRRLEAFRPRMRLLCEELLESLDAEFEFVASIAWPLSTLVITELLGVDPAMHGDFKIWSDRIIADKLNPLADEETRALGAQASEAIDAIVRAEV